MSLFIKRIKSPIRHLNRNYCSLFVPKFEYLSDDNFDCEYYFNKDNLNEIKNNLHLRRSNKLLTSLNQSSDQQKWIQDHIKLLPNRLHDKWKQIDVESAKEFDKDQFVVDECPKPDLDFKPQRAETAFDNFGLLMLGTKGLGTIGGPRSYMMLDDLVDLKNALVDYTLDKLVKKYKFNFVTVPNLIYNETLSGCGFNVAGDRDLVYKLKNKNGSSIENSSRSPNDFRSNQVCLSGTSEIPLAGLHFGEVLDADQLPFKYCTVSRCYRKEISFLAKENGIYRVHYFDKVEMFALTDKQSSEKMLNEFITIQKELFTDLKLPIKVLDMPPHELGSSAASKYDVECWLPGRDLYGEISSASNCTDFQSRRFNIKYKYLDLNYETNEPFAYDFVHTVNGTACAVPRMLIAIGENHQQWNSQVLVPDVLRPYMNDTQRIQYRRNFLKKKKNQIW